MAHLLRGKQAGVHKDLSAGLGSDLFALDYIKTFGLNSQISQIAYDPVQSLLAVGTSETQYGTGQIYIFGQKRVEVVFPLPRKGASVRILQFCGDKLLCVDSKNDLNVYDLLDKRCTGSYSPPGKVTAICCEAGGGLDYVLLGTQNGEIFAYDLEREGLAPFKIANLWREEFPRSRLSSVVTLAFHPRDIGKLLIGYSAGAVVYSFKQNKAQKFFEYVLPKGAQGGLGDSDPAGVYTERRPALTQAVWHPTGTFVLTGHEDSSIVIWDPKDGRLVQARTLQDTNINVPGGPGSLSPGAQPGSFAVKTPIFRIQWCCKEDPDDTGILIAGGAPSTLATKSLTFFDLGRTPVYNTSSWQILSDHFENPRRQRILPCPPGTEVIDVCLIPRSSPHFAGAQDPIALIALLASGELITLSFPSGMPISPTNMLHLNLTMVHPFIQYANLAPADRTRWLGMTEKRIMGPQFLVGGKEATLPFKRFEHRNIVQTAHADGTVKLWDAGHGDEVENDALLQIDVGRAVGRQEGVEVTRTSFAGGAGELSVGLRSGEVAVFRWGVNKHAGQDGQFQENATHGLTDITTRAEAALKEGLLPFTLLTGENTGPVTALKHSDIGFVAAGTENGSLSVIDLRGPALIYSANTSDFIKADKRSSFRRSSTPSATKKVESITTLEFSVMTSDSDDYSSILLHAGTSAGHLATFKILPDQSGRHSAAFAGAVHLDDRVISITPIQADTGHRAKASPDVVAGLRRGERVTGVLVAVTVSGVHIFRPASHKGAHKSWDAYLCDSASVVRYQDLGSCVVGLFGDGYARTFSIPALKEIGSVKISDALDVRRFSEAVITATGDVLGWKGPAEMALVNVFGTGLKEDRGKDVLWNPEVVPPARPTISNLQWISGTQFVSEEDMDLLIGGPDRPPSKRMRAQALADEQEQRRQHLSSRHPGASSSSAGPAGSQEGWGAWASRQLNERTEKLNLVGDSMDSLSSNSAGWADDVSKFVNKQKRGFVMGAVKGKFGL